MKRLSGIFKLWNSKSKTEKLIIKVINETAFDISIDKQLIRK